MPNNRNVRFIRGATAAVCVAAGATAYEPVAPPKNVVMPQARTAAESLAAIKVRVDLRVELVAAEPLVMDPIDVAWGLDGRMWVVEMADYPMGMDGKGQPGGRIRVLESTRGDGNYDKSTLFADGLNFPNSVMPWRAGALVAAAPDVLYLEDTDHDGRADRSEKVVTGFREGNEQHRANGLQWGLDGWLYLANGNSGGKITSPKTGQVLELGRRDLRISPDEGIFESVSGQTQYGRARDDWGNWFGGNNSNPIWHYALEERYLARNPHFVAPNATVTVATIPGAAPVYPVSQALSRFNDAGKLNHFTSACGTMIYRDTVLGAAYAGNVFVCEPVHNLVHRELVSPEGVTFVSRRAPEEQTSEFFASADAWSRFTSARTGPDGALYIVDMYRLVIEHPTWIPDAWQKILGDLRAGADKGRIYRVVPNDGALRPIPRLDRMDADELAAAMDNPNGTVRDLAQQALTWRRAKGATARLERLVTHASAPQTRVQAVCTLDTAGMLTPAMVLDALRDEHPGVLRQASRLSERFAHEGNEALLSAVLALAEHADAVVRQQVAYTLGEWKLPAAGAALARIVQESRDPFIRAAGMSSALSHAETLLERLDARTEQDSLVEIAIVTRNAAALARLLNAICAPREPAQALEQLEAFGGVLETLRRHNQTLASLHAGAGEAMRKALADAVALLARAQATAADGGTPLDRRLAAVGLLGWNVDREREDAQILTELLGPRSPLKLQQAALEALRRFETGAIADKLLLGFAGYAPSIRATVLDLLMSRPAWVNALLDRLERDRPLLAQVDLGRRATLTRHGHPQVAERARKIFGAGVDLNRQQVIERYLQAMSALEPQPAKGAGVFAAFCAACHRFGDIPGHPIGPDIASVKDRSRDYLVAHILDPNRAVEDRYMLYEAVTSDGRIFAGMLTDETANNITIRSLDGGDQLVGRAELKSVAARGVSLMPDGFESGIDPQAMADLVAFIAGEEGVSTGKPSPP